MRHPNIRTCEHIHKTRIAVILKGLMDNGTLVTNPWDIDTPPTAYDCGEEWSEDASMLTIAIMEAGSMSSGEDLGEERGASVDFGELLGYAVPRYRHGLPYFG